MHFGDMKEVYDTKTPSSVTQKVSPHTLEQKNSLYVCSERNYISMQLGQGRERERQRASLRFARSHKLFSQ